VDADDFHVTAPPVYDAAPHRFNNVFAERPDLIYGFTIWTDVTCGFIDSLSILEI
jgi:hypothetical protein